MVWKPFRKSRARELEALDRWRTARKLANDDVTDLGEQLAELHVDTLSSDLGHEATHHYRQALEHYEQAKAMLASSTTAEEVLVAEQLMADGHYHRASVLALEIGDPLPERGGPCFFDPRHGPSMRDVQWSPPSGVAKTVSVCAADAKRLEGGEEPRTRLIRVGDRYVPVHEADGLEAIIDRQRSLTHERLTSYNRKHIAETSINATFNGLSGPGSPFS